MTSAAKELRACISILPVVLCQDASSPFESHVGDNWHPQWQWGLKGDISISCVLAVLLPFLQHPLLQCFRHQNLQRFQLPVEHSFWMNIKDITNVNIDVIIFDMKIFIRVTIFLYNSSCRSTGFEDFESLKEMASIIRNGRVHLRQNPKFPMHIPHSTGLSLRRPEDVQLSRVGMSKGCLWAFLKTPYLCPNWPGQVLFLGCLSD